MSEAFIGVDVGTASARAGVFDDAGLASLAPAADRRFARGRRDRRALLGRHLVARLAPPSARRWRRSRIAPGADRRHRLRRHLFAGRARRATARSLTVSPSGDPSATRSSGWTIAPSRRPPRSTPAATTRCATSAASSRRRCSRPKLMWLARHVPRNIRARAILRPRPTSSPSAPAARRRARPAPSSANGSTRAASGAGRTEFFARVGLGALLDDGVRRIGAEIVAPGAPLGARTYRRGGRGDGIAAGRSGRRRADRRPRRRARARIGGALGDETRRSAPRLALILGTSSCCMALSDEARFVPGVWGPHL